MDRKDGFDGFQLDQHKTVHNEVGPKANFQRHVIVGNGNRFLPLHLKSVTVQFDGESRFIYRFKQTRPKRCVNFECGVEHSPGNFFLGHSFASFAASRDASSTSALSSAIDLRMNKYEMIHTNGKNRTPSTNHVSVNPNTRTAISSGQK